MRKQLAFSFVLGTVLGLCIWWTVASFGTVPRATNLAQVRFVTTSKQDGVLQGHLMVEIDGRWYAAAAFHPRGRIPLTE